MKGQYFTPILILFFLFSIISEFLASPVKVFSLVVQDHSFNF